MIKKIFNKLGYYKLNQLKFGGMCGCCGVALPHWAWVSTGNNWDDIGICESCQSGNTEDDAKRLISAISKQVNR